MLTEKEIDMLTAHGWKMVTEIPAIFYKPTTSPYEELHGEIECKMELSKLKELKDD